MAAAVGVEDTGRGATSVKRTLQSASIYAAMAGIILVPAIWNGFPFVYADTGGYFARPFEGTLAPGRSALYGAFLAGGIPLEFWPNIAIQALICAWIIRLVLRTDGLGRPAIATGATIALCLATSMPWYADLLMPDVFLPLAVLALYLLAFASSDLRRWEIAALVEVVAFAVAAHMSILAVALVVFASFVALWAAAKWLTAPRPRLWLPAVAIIAGAALALASNSLIAGTAAFTPGGPTLLFARLLQDGFVKTYLDRNCPSPALSLCSYRDTLPIVADDWLWDGSSPLYRLGGWDAFAPEARRIVIGSIMQQPGAQLRAAVTGTLVQLRTVATGEGIDNRYNWHTEWKLHEYAPRTLPRFNAARQQREAIDFPRLNLLQVPLALGATLALPVLVVLCWRRRQRAAAFGYCAFVALISNAAICATFSGVVDRYQSRIVWIAVLATAVLCFKSIRPESPGKHAKPSLPG